VNVTHSLYLLPVRSMFNSGVVVYTSCSQGGGPGVLGPEARRLPVTVVSHSAVTLEETSARAPCLTRGAIRYRGTRLRTAVDD
jgi:hypothetical protein